MARSSRRTWRLGACVRLALSVALVVAGCGCATGHLLETARRGESVAAYRAFSVDGARLRLSYTAEVTRWDGALLNRRESIAVLDLDDLQLAEASSLDDLSVRFVEPQATRRAADTPTGRYRMRVLVTPGGVQRGFVLEDAQRPGRFAAVPSDALHRDRTSLWVLPLLPFAVAWDIATTLPLALAAVPYLFVGR